MNNGSTHPENDLEQIFGWPDRVAVYQYRVRDAIAAMNLPNAGAQVSFSGCLFENVQSLADHNSLGYYNGWQYSFQEARSWLTTGGKPKLDMVIFPYHHALAPLIDESALRKEIQIYKDLYPELWGTNQGISTGFFPPELAFSQRIIKVLVEEGIDYVFVSNSHLSRACSDFPFVAGSGGEMADPPNPADQLNPPGVNYFSKYIDRGCSPANAYPFAYRPHYARYVDPETGEEYRIILVPVAMAMSWSDGYQMYGTDDIDQIAWANDPEQPMLIVLGHDGDNAWGGGYSYYMESVPSFTSSAQANGYTPTVVAQYLQDHPVDWNDVVHVEDGAWVNADGDFGSPDFINWNWPLVNSSGQFDVANGWAEDARNWAVITAAQNRVETAEQIAGGVSISAIRNPTGTSPSQAELAWHFFLPALTSGYMYYGAALDMEVKATIACNNAVEHADQVIGDGSQDATPPTVWIPQQFPHNPGGTGFGALWNYQTVQHDRDFWIWTFAYDVSGVDAVQFCYRIDIDGNNPLTSDQNETYDGGSEVTDWVCLPMNRRDFPAGNYLNDPNINFFEMPQYIAQQFYTHVTVPELTETGGKLIDYYVEATDTRGYVKKSPILHTYIGTGEGSGGGESVSWSPDEPQAGGSVTILYDADEGALPDAVSPVFIHIGHSGWQNILSPDPAMQPAEEDMVWEYTYQIPSSATSVDFVFHNGQGAWDNNNGMDWSISVTGSDGPPYQMDGDPDANAQLIATSTGIDLYAHWNGELLYLAATSATGTGKDQFIFITDGSTGMTDAPWAKSGQIAGWIAYLGNEESNGWAGWFDTSQGTYTAVQTGAVTEGVISLASETGSLPENIFIALGVYQSPDGGSLTDQLPSTTNGDGDIQLDEFFIFPLSTSPAGDVTGDGITDILDVVRMVSFILGWLNPTESEFTAADMNNDGTVDVLDVVAVIELIMGE